MSWRGGEGAQLGSRREEGGVSAASAEREALLLDGEDTAVLRLPRVRDTLRSGQEGRHLQDGWRSFKDGKLLMSK